MTVLGLSEDALESEGDLVKLVFLQTLADDLSDQILPNQRAPITEAKARSAHKDFQREMKAWEGDSNGKTRSRKSLSKKIDHDAPTFSIKIFRKS